MTHRLRLALAVGLAAFSASGAAHARGKSAETRIYKANSGQRAVGENASQPVEQAIDTLRAEHGWSFIFDSRLIADKNLSGKVKSILSERDLVEAFASAGLQLHQVAAKTYAITSLTNTVASPEIDTLAVSGPEMPIDTILVMGSSTMAPAMTGSKRIFKLDADDLAFLNVTAPAEAVYSLPQSLASFTPSNTALFASAAGISLADLRGLGPKRTMVLVNGRRRTLTTGGNGDIGGVDLGAISEPLLERIEVQSLPAGARYGAGAVAGAINFVTKNDFDGMEAGLRLGMSERGDSEEISLHAIAGGQIENIGSLTVGLNITRNEGLVGADREFSAVPYGYALNGVKDNSPAAAYLPGFGGSSTTDRGAVAGVILSDGTFSAFPNGETYVPAADGSIAPFRGALNQLYNWAQWQSVTLPSDRVIGQLSFKSRLSDDLNFFIDAEGGVVASDTVLAPLPAARFRGTDPVAGDAAVISLSNPFLPQSVIDAAHAAFGSNVSAVVYEHRFAELGPRRQQIDRRHFDLATGIQLGEDDDRTLSLTYRYGRNRTTSREQDRVDQEKVKVALDPAVCAVTPGCVLADFFTAPELSKPVLDFITLPEISRILTIDEHEITANASTQFSFDDDHDGRLSAGVELRRAAFSDLDKTPAGASPIAYLGGTTMKGVLQTLEAYAEIDSPVYRSDRFPGELDASLAFRLAYSSNFEVATNFEAGVDWRPIPGVALFTRQHIGDRTPDIIEMLAIGSGLETYFQDPCGADPADQSDIIKANCATAGPLGVNPGFVQTATLAAETFYGNPDLSPEHVRSGAYGVTLSPTELVDAIPGSLELTATWLDFKIKNSIFAPSDVLFDCYSSPGFKGQNCLINPRTGSPSIIRDPSTRQIVSFDSVLANDGDLRWRGLDLEMRYALQPENLAFADSLWMSVLHTYTDEVAMTQFGSTQRLDGLLDYPRHRTLASVGVEKGRWSFVAYANRRGRALTARSLRPEARVPAALYIDLTGRFEVTDNAYVQLGVKNLTDRKPDITAFNTVGNFAPQFYDPIGRRYTLAFRINF
ncbi:MAG: TonB-dependent receptor [Pseudomonadota bacterium]